MNISPLKHRKFEDVTYQKQRGHLAFKITKPCQGIAMATNSVIHVVHLTLSSALDA